MPSDPKPASLLWLLGFILIFSSLVIPRIFRESPTNDEPVEITNGYFYWQGDVVSHNHHPPLPKMLQALPLKFLHLNNEIDPRATNYLARAYDFLFILNLDRLGLLLALSRFVSLFFGIGIGCLLFFACRQSPRPVLLGTLALWAFEPNLSACSGLVVADVPVAFFFLAAVLAFHKYKEKPSVPRSLLAGLLASMAVTSKFSALVLIPIFIVVDIFSTPVVMNPKSSPPALGKFKGWLWGALSFFTWIFFLYLPGTLLLKEHLLPWTYFFKGLANMAAYSGFHHPSYFLGEASRQNHWLYYPLAFLLKSTLPFLLLVLIGAYLGIRKKMEIPVWIWLSALLAFLCILPVQNLGVRYLLPAYPFLLLIGGKAFGEIWKGTLGLKTQLGKMAAFGLLFWHAASVMAAFPGMISYFNDLVPPERKFYYLGDSNLDWGQDVKTLAKVGLEKGWKNFKLAQAGGVDPQLYGLKWSSWTERDLTGPQPGTVYAVNESFLQIAPVFYPDLIPIATGWICQAVPTGKIGESWFYFEFPGTAPPDSSKALPSVHVGQNHSPEEEGKNLSGGEDR